MLTSIHPLTTLPLPLRFVRPKDFDPSLWIVRLGKELGKSAQARVLAIPWLCGDAAVFKVCVRLLFVTVSL